MTRRPRATSPPRQCTVTLSGGVLDQLHRRVEHDVLGEQGGQPLRDLAGATDEPGGLRAALGLREQLARRRRRSGG